jgi:nucleoside-diphosphate-sugar epimerase
MKILITGATGVLARATIPSLVADGHELIGVTRHHLGRRWLRERGATPIELDLFDVRSVRSAMPGIDAVIHLATAIPALADATRSQAWEQNDRLRSVATAVLVDAARDAGVGRFVQESITFNYTDAARAWIDEDHDVAPLVPATASALTAERLVDGFATGTRVGVSLRFSNLYGPGDVSADLVDMLRRRRVPQVGPGTNYVSNIHIDDAASAIVVALGLPSGRYNVSDDEPVEAAERLHLQASGSQAPNPRRVPAPLARLIAGSSVRLLTVSQRVSNRRLRDMSSWQPHHPSIKTGWLTVSGSLVGT